MDGRIWEAWDDMGDEGLCRMRGDVMMGTAERGAKQRKLYY